MLKIVVLEELRVVAIKVTVYGDSDSLIRLIYEANEDCDANLAAVHYVIWKK